MTPPQQRLPETQGADVRNQGGGRSDRRGWLAVTILLFLYIVSMIDRHLITLLAEPIRHDLGLTDFELSLLFGFAFAAFYSVMGLPFGALADRISRRRILYVCITFWSLSASMCGLARGFPSMFMARMGVGAGEAGLLPSAYSMIADLFPANRLSLPLSVFQMGAKVGQSLSLLLGAFLATLFIPSETYRLFTALELKGWQLIFLLVGLPGVIFAFAVFLIDEPERRREAGVPTDMNFRDYFRLMARQRRFFFGHHVGFLCLLSAMVAVTSWAPVYLQRVHGLGPGETGGVLGLILLVSTIVGLPLHGSLVDVLYRRGHKDVHLTYLVASAMIAMPFGAIAFLTSSEMTCFVSLGLFFFFLAPYASLPIIALQMSVPAIARGKASAVMTVFAGLLGYSFGPTSVAVLNEILFADPHMIGSSTAVCVLALISAGLLLVGLASRASREEG